MSVDDAVVDERAAAAAKPAGAIERAQGVAAVAMVVDQEPVPIAAAAEPALSGLVVTKWKSPAVGGTISFPGGERMALRVLVALKFPNFGFRYGNTSNCEFVGVVSGSPEGKAAVNAVSDAQLSFLGRLLSDPGLEKKMGAEHWKAFQSEREVLAKNSKLAVPLSARYQCWAIWSAAIP